MKALNRRSQVHVLVQNHEHQKPPLCG
jgi:hypothetical protein